MNFFDIEIAIICILMGLMVWRSLESKIDVSQTQSIVPQDTSALMKALCCIIIIMHHFALRIDGGLIVRICQMGGGGNFSLVIFLLLSSYGITKSELKHPLCLKEYATRRFLKLLKPYAIIMVIFIAVYWLIGANATSEELKSARISPVFVELGQHQVRWLDILGYFVGVSTINGSLWYVGVTVFSYFAFYVSKSVFSIKNKSVMCLLLYASLLAVLGFASYMLDFPAHYWRNLWALLLGFALAIYEKRIFSLSLSLRIAIYALTNLIVYLYLRLTQSGDVIYLFFANMGFLSIILSSELFKRYTLKKTCMITTLFMLSYEIYLIHGYVFPIEWWYTGYQSAALTILFCVTLAFLYRDMKKIIIYCNNNFKRYMK